MGINAAVIEMPTDVSINIGGSAYASSKIAQARMLEHLASENPDLFVVSVHPGILKTDMLATFDFKDGNHPPVDEGKHSSLDLPTAISATLLFS